MATIVKSREHSGGTESTLESCSWVVLFLGLVVGVIFFYWAAESGSKILWIATGVLVVGQSWFVSVLLKGGADVIRLLKKQNNLPYSGQIKNHEYEIDACSECGNSIDVWATYCPLCDAKFPQNSANNREDRK